MLFLRLTLLVITVSNIRAVSIYKHQHYYKNHNGHPDDNGNCPDPKLSDCRAGFSYNRKICPGPAGWSSISTCFHACNNGHRQSPINIDSDRAYYVSWLPPLRFESQFEAEETEVSNHRNHAPEFESDDEEEIYLKLNQLKEGRYKFRNLHVHNGRRRRRGSEHSVNGRFTPMEAHVVFYEDDVTLERSSRVRIGGRYGYSDAFVVIGVFLEVDDDDFGDEPDDDECENILSGDQDYGQRKKRRDGNTNHEQGKGGRNSHFWNSFENDDDGDDDNDDDSSSSNESYETDDINDNYNANGWRWWNYLGVRKGGNRNWFGRGRCKVRKARRLSRILECAYRNKKVRKFKHLGDQEELEVDIRPEDVLPPRGHRQYYTYEGSLTTPPCNETVHWIVMKCHVKVSERVLDALRNVEGYPDGKTLRKFGTRRPTQSNRNPVYKNFWE